MFSYSGRAAGVPECRLFRLRQWEREVTRDSLGCSSHWALKEVSVDWGGRGRTVQPGEAENSEVVTPASAGPARYSSHRDQMPRWVKGPSVFDPGSFLPRLMIFCLTLCIVFCLVLVFLLFGFASFPVLYCAVFSLVSVPLLMLCVFLESAHTACIILPIIFIPFSTFKSHHAYPFLGEAVPHAAHCDCFDHLCCICLDLPELRPHIIYRELQSCM